MKIDITKNNLRIYAIIAIVVAILFGAILYLLINNERESNIKEQRVNVSEEFSGFSIGTSFVYYSSIKNEFTVVSTKILTDSEKQQIKDEIIKKVGQDYKYVKDGNDIKISFEVEGSGGEKPSGYIKDDINTPYDTSNPDVKVDPDDVILD